MTTRQRQHRLKPKRTKQYRPRELRIPVMRNLVDEFGLVLHMALETARIGCFSHKQYERIGQAINVVWGALYLKPPKDPAIVTVIEGAMRTMNQAGTRSDASGNWHLRPEEQAAILAGIHKIEEHLPSMDVMTLYNSMQLIKTMPAGSLDFAAQAGRRAA